MRLDDTIKLQYVITSEDEELNTIENVEWSKPYKCKILPNNAASVVKCNDGECRVYSYTIIMKKPKVDRDIPRENSIIMVIKKDKTINSECRVLGFVTLRNWVKLWV